MLSWVVSDSVCSPQSPSGSGLPPPCLRRRRRRAAPEAPCAGSVLKHLEGQGSQREAREEVVPVPLGSTSMFHARCAGRSARPLGSSQGCRRSNPGKLRAVTSSTTPVNCGTSSTCRVRRSLFAMPLDRAHSLRKRLQPIPVLSVSIARVIMIIVGHVEDLWNGEHFAARQSVQKGSGANLANHSLSTINAQRGSTKAKQGIFASRIDTQAGPAGRSSSTQPRRRACIIAKGQQKLTFISYSYNGQR